MTICPVLYCFVLCYYAGLGAAGVKVEGEKGSNAAAGVVMCTPRPVHTTVLLSVCQVFSYTNYIVLLQ